MTFMAAKRAIGFKKETTPYTAESLSASEYDFRARDVSYTPEIAAFARKYAVGDYSAFESVIGKKSCTVSWSVDLAPAVDGLDNEPEWSEMFECSAWAQTSHAGTGISWAPNSCSVATPATIEVQELEPDCSDAIVIKVRGAMGNVTIAFDEVGTPIRADFEFQGVLVGISDRSSPFSPAGFDATTPDAVLSATITAFGDALPINSMQITSGNSIEMYTDPSNAEGLRGAYVTNREPTVTLDPYLDLLATRDMWSRWSGGTTGALSIAVGSGATKMTISAPAMQITKAYGSADRDGIVSHSLEGILTRATEAGDDELELLQGSKT